VSAAISWAPAVFLRPAAASTKPAVFCGLRWHDRLRSDRSYKGQQEFELRSHEASLLDLLIVLMGALRRTRRAV